jgi:DHA2 family multidrug resistance protein
MSESATKKETGSRLKWLVLATVIVGTFLGRIDQTIVNLALPKIIEDFHITVSAAGWIATAYILANAIFVPIWGKLGDTIGRKKVYIFGFSIFIIGSVLAGLSWNLGSLIVFRVIQAVASSADYPTAMAILTVTFAAGKERSQALGIWSTSFAAASVFGPLIGGPLIDVFGWRSVFLVNLPIGIVGLLMALAYVRESVSGENPPKFDWWGSITLGVALSAIVLVLDQGVTWGWTSSNSLWCYVTTLVFALIFARIEVTHPEPIVDFKFFKNSVFVNTLVNNFIIFMALSGSVFLIPVFAQTFLGLTATQSGLLFIPMALFFVASSPIGGSFIGKVQPRYIIALSTLIAGIGLVFLVRLDPRSTAWDLIWPLMVMAFGMGLGMAQRTGIIASVVPAKEIGVASAILALGRNMAGAFGIAIFATILNDETNSKVLAIARHTIINVHTPAVMNTVIGLIILKAQISSYGTVFVDCALLLLIGAVAALFIKLDRMRTDIHVHIE